MAKYFIEDTTLESMADTIRSLTGSTAPLTPSEMTAGVQEAKEDVDSAMDALETLGVEVPEGSDVGDLAGLVGEVEVGGDGAELARSIVDGTITEYVDEEITIVRAYAFYYSGVSKVVIPNATQMGKSVFYKGNNLKSIDAPLVQSVEEYTCYQCGSLQEIDFSQITSVGAYAFYKCTSLREIDFPKATSVAGNTFNGCSSVNNVNLPSLINVSSGSYAFRDMTSLKSIKLPSLQTLGSYDFQGCTNLALVDLPKVTAISSSCFFNCSRLETLILRKTDSISTLLNTGAFQNTLIKSGGTGYIYVPSALIDTYKSATNWSTYADQFRALEDYTVDGTITGELDESKI